MKIQVSGLSAGIHRYSFTAQPSALGLGEEFGTALTIAATLEKAATRLLLQATVRAEGRFNCDRCVEPFVAPLSSSYTMVYVMEGSDTEGLDPAEIQVVPRDLAVIDLSEDVRQTALLSVPLKLICREDCKGLCPHCGKNLNTGTCDCVDQVPDSRWDKLRLLRENRS